VSTPPPPLDLPRFFLDRNMGDIKVPTGLRALGVELTTLSERYGVQEGQWVEDVDWMPTAAHAGEAVLMSDAAIRKKNPEERRILIECGLGHSSSTDKSRLPKLSGASRPRCQRLPEHADTQALSSTDSTQPLKLRWP
jgi:hypothetical protein